MEEGHATFQSEKGEGAVDEIFIAKPEGGSRQQIRKEMGLTDADIVIIGVGRLVKRKNWNEALQGCGRVAQKHKNIRFILIGDGPERKALEKFAWTVGCPIMFVGYQSQQAMLDFYQAADILIQTSTYDPSPKVLNEALGVGLPMIVSSSVGTAGEICVHEVNGFVYPKGEIDVLQKAISVLVESKELRGLYGNASKELSEKWSITVGVRNIIQALDEN